MNIHHHFHSLSKKIPYSIVSAAPRKIHFAINRDKIATISLNPSQGKIEVISLASLEAIDYLFNEAKQLNAKAMIIYMNNIADADLKMIREGLDDPALLEKIVKTGQRLFLQLSNLPFPTFAFIHNACLGGAMELGLYCTYRVVTDDPKTILGLPEVKMGLFPCWGGTQALPRLVGGPQALNLILNGETVSAKTAREIKLADAIFSRELLEDEGKAFIDSCLTPEGKKKVINDRKEFLNPVWPGFSNPKNKATGMITCDLIYKTNELSLVQGLEEECKAMLQMPPELAQEAKNRISDFLEKKPESKELV